VHLGVPMPQALLGARALMAVPTVWQGALEPMAC
jgi:hypothetical protein